MKKFITPGYAKISWFVCCFILLISACSKEQRSTTAPVSQNDTTVSYKTFLALGDSYTIGQSVNTEQRFPFQTLNMLYAQGVTFNQPNIIATTGWTTGNLINALNSNPPAGTYDVVSLLIGVNNQYQGRNKEEYRLHFTELLNKAISYAASKRSHVFVLSIPDYSITPFAQNSDTARIAREIDDFNAINKEITLQYGIAWLDITPISREAKNDPSLLAVDGLHPSGKQYQRWAALLAPLVKAAL